MYAACTRPLRRLLDYFCGLYREDLSSAITGGTLVAIREKIIEFPVLSISTVVLRHSTIALGQQVSSPFEARARHGLADGRSDGLISFEGSDIMDAVT
jgi:hypothetical protein